VAARPRPGRAVGSAAAVAITLGVAWGAGPQRAAAQLPQPPEYAVKAAFLYHFVQLVSWPQADAGASPIVLAVVGRDPFGDLLESTVVGRSVRGRPLRVVRAASVADLPAEPDLVFLGAASVQEAERALSALRSRPVLTVGELPGLARRGAMVEFRLTADDRVSFDINLAEVERARLKMSSQLLRIARVVGPRP
jgi:hypothetical protein